MHNLHIRLSLRIEIRPSFAAAHRQRGKRILESLLESEEFQNRLVDRGMETDTAFIRADGIVVLHTVAHIVLHAPLIVDPRHTEREYAVGDAQTLYQIVAFELGMLIVDFLNRGNHFFHSLQVFRLVRKPAAQIVDNFSSFHSNVMFSCRFPCKSKENFRFKLHNRTKTPHSATLLPLKT